MSDRKLVLRVGGERRRFALGAGRSVVIGRGAEVEVCIATPLVSRRHCEIVMGGQGLELRDLGSMNGTFLNGQRVDSAALCEGDVVRVGDDDITIEVEPIATAPSTCDRCGRLISVTTLEDGQTFELGERIVCATCRAGGHTTADVERKLSAALEAEGFAVLGRLSPRSSWCPVFKARRVDLDDVVAVKVLPLGEGLPEKKRDRFKVEARAMAQAKHPSLVPVFEVRHRPSFSVMVMEFVPGETLLQRIERKKKLRTGEVIRHMTALAGALEAASKLGVVHRNVKPSNVIVERGTGEPRLIDFGLARNLRAERAPSETDASAPLGTIRYMAPEQMRDPHAVDGRADLYSLAATIFHALTGKLPHHERNELELLQAALDGRALAFDVSRENEIPQPLKSVLACALMPDAKDRQPNATVLIDELRAAAAKIPESRDATRSISGVVSASKPDFGAFVGDQLIELLRTISIQGRSGTLEAKSGVRGGSLVLVDGRVVAARTFNGARGDGAVHQVLGLWKGDWIFRPGQGLEVEPDDDLAPTHALILEALRRRDEYGTQVPF